MRRVVITGLGLVAPTGNSVQQAWAGALAGRSAASPITLFDASQLPVRIAAEVKGFDPASGLPAKEARQSSRFVQFACCAVKEAMEDAGEDACQVPDRSGCMIGVGIGAISQIEEGTIQLREEGPRRISPLLMPYIIPNMAAGLAAIQHNLRGPTLCTATACAGGTHAIGEAYTHIRAGAADLVVAGGAEAAISPLCIASFARMKALSTQNNDPSRASRPFDLNRDGFVMGEGSGVVVVEELEHAQRRNAPIYAELAGYGSSCDAYHISGVDPEGDGLARSVAAALRSGQINLADVDYINAHGTSTQANDSTESAAIEMVFGQHAGNISISSTKGVTGHCLGAAGGIEAVYTVLAVQRGVAPPTANYETPDPGCRLDYTAKGPRERRIRCALSQSRGFGGMNAVLAFKRFDG